MSQVELNHIEQVADQHYPIPQVDITDPESDYQAPVRAVIAQNYFVEGAMWALDQLSTPEVVDAVADMLRHDRMTANATETEIVRKTRRILRKARKVVET